MKKSECKNLLHLNNKCLKCKKKLKIVFDTWPDGEKVYYLKCVICGWSYEGVL